MQSPPFPRYLVPPRSKYSPQHHVLNDQVSHLYKTTSKIIVLYILIMDCIGLAQDRDRWLTLVSAVMNLRVP